MYENVTNLTLVGMPLDSTPDWAAARALAEKPLDDTTLSILQEGYPWLEETEEIAEALREDVEEMAALWTAHSRNLAGAQLLPIIGTVDAEGDWSSEYAAAERLEICGLLQAAGFQVG